jgi:uncharacterized membrane protein YesL
MKSIFSHEGVLFRITERIGNLILLNLLYLITCIPIVTIGPATAALHYVTLKYAANEEDRVWEPFMHSFKQNLKQGILVGLITTFVGVGLAFSMYYIYQMVSAGLALDKVVMVIVSLTCILYLMANAYIYPLLARYENSIKQMLRTALLLAIRHLPATVCLGIISGAPILMLMYTPVTFMIALSFYFFIGFSAIAFLQDKLVVRIFWQYTPRETTIEE